MIIIGADFVPTKSNYELFEHGNATELFGAELSALLSYCDYRIFNLETPMTDIESPISKCGPALIAPEAAVAGYKAANVNLLTLANNHILDQSEQGLLSTRRILEENSIAYVGAGDNLSEACRPYFFELKGKNYGVYACAEHEFSIATDDAMGANPFDPLESLDHITGMKEQCDYIIVLYHGGKEHYRYPSPQLQKVCRKIVEKGANLVICQHSHCIGCEEKYLDSTIVYGQGNFLFDHSKSEYWNTGLLVQIDDRNEITYVPIVKNGSTVRLASDEQSNEILGDFYKRSEEIKSTGTVEKKYAEFSRSMIDSCLDSLSGKRSLLFRVINKLTGQRLSKWYIARHYGINERYLVRNYMECEAWREMILSGIGNS